MITFCGGEQKRELGNYAVKRNDSAVPRGWRNPLQGLIECNAYEVGQLSERAVGWGGDETLTKVSRHRGGQQCRNQIPVQGLVISGSCPASAASLTNAWKVMIGGATMVESSREASRRGGAYVIRHNLLYVGSLWERFGIAETAKVYNKGRGGGKGPSGI
jgi:hypothetical protein